MRNTFINCLIRQAETDSRIFLITPDMGFSVLEDFEQKFPDRFLNVGIAEQNAIGVAAGLALSGKIVYVYSITPFVTMRCFEQIRIDMAYMNTNVRIIGIGSGFSYGASGVSHHAIEDISIMRSLPNMTVCCPGDTVEAEALIKQSFSHNGPIYFRLEKTRELPMHNAEDIIQLGKASVIQEGSEVAIITTSSMLSVGKKYADKLQEKPYLISMHTIKPIDKDIIMELIEKNVTIITLEEHSIIGGLGSAVAEIIAESGKAVKFRRVGIPDVYSHYVGDQDFQREQFGFYDLPEKIGSV